MNKFDLRAAALWSLTTLAAISLTAGCARQDQIAQTTNAASGGQTAQSSARPSPPETAAATPLAQPNATGATNVAPTAPVGAAVPATTPPASLTGPPATVGSTTPGPAPTSLPTVKAPAAKIESGGNDFFLFTQVRAAINSDAALSNSRQQIIIEVAGSAVTLSGTVPNADVKSKAEQAARKVSGVKEVKNQLRVKSGA